MENRYKVIDLWAKMNLMKTDKIKECTLTVLDDGVICFKGIGPKDPDWDIDYEDVCPIGYVDTD